MAVRFNAAEAVFRPWQTRAIIVYCAPLFQASETGETSWS
jgi:hypothetical protein